MKNDYNKEYFEKYALLSLVYCYDDKLHSMKKHERPDWIDENRSIGLEVTRALSSTDGERESIIERYFCKGYTPEEIINKANCELKYNKDMFKIADGFCYVEKNVNYSDVKQLIIDTINTKISKLNSNYDKFNKNWLYVFTDSSLLDDGDIEEIILKINNIAGNSSFDKIFINIIDKIYVIEDNLYSKIDVTDSELARIKKNLKINNVKMGRNKYHE